MSSLDIGDSAHIPGPSHKLIAFIRPSDKGDHCPDIAREDSLAGIGHRAAGGAGDGEVTHLLHRLNRNAQPINDVLCLADDRVGLRASENQTHKLPVLVDRGP